MEANGSSFCDKNVPLIQFIEQVNGLSVEDAMRVMVCQERLTPVRRKVLELRVKKEVRERARNEGLFTDLDRAEIDALSIREAKAYLESGREMPDIEREYVESHILRREAEGIHGYSVSGSVVDAALRLRALGAIHVLAFASENHTKLNAAEKSYLISWANSRMERKNAMEVKLPESSVEVISVGPDSEAYVSKQFYPPVIPSKKPEDYASAEVEANERIVERSCREKLEEVRRKLNRLDLVPGEPEKVREIAADIQRFLDRLGD